MGEQHCEPRAKRLLAGEVLYTGKKLLALPVQPTNKHTGRRWRKSCSRAEHPNRVDPVAAFNGVEDAVLVRIPNVVPSGLLLPKHFVNQRPSNIQVGHHGIGKKATTKRGQRRRRRLC